MLDDFKLLTKEGNLAFYKSAEVTTIYLHNTKTGDVINVYTNICFEENSVSENLKKIHLDNNFYPGYRLGLIQYKESIPTISKMFEQLFYNNEWKYNGTFLKLENPISHIPKNFIPTSESPLNKLFKNNSANGCYILEFFDEKKEILSFLVDKQNRMYLEKLAQAVRPHFPAELSIIKDRVGNLIFQFPISLIKVAQPILPGWTGVDFELEYHPQLLKKPLLHVLKAIEFDGAIASFGSDSRTVSGTKPIPLTDSSRMNFSLVYNPANQLILHCFFAAPVVNLGLSFRAQHKEVRLFSDRSEEIRLTSAVVRMPRETTFHIRQDGTRWSSGSDDNAHIWVRERIYEQEREELERELLFKQYAARSSRCKTEIDEEMHDALSDIRYLIKKYGENGVYLIDPYLSADDIINTLYYSTIVNAPLKAIGSSKRYKRFRENQMASPQTELEDDSKKENWLAKTRQRFETSGNNIGINLEFRFVCNGYGWHFHDRFIIFPQADRSKPKVWSLGISVSQLGYEHHILQEIKNAQNIMDAFEELWDSLDDPICIAYKSK